MARQNQIQIANQGGVALLNGSYGCIQDHAFQLASLIGSEELLIIDPIGMFAEGNIVSPVTAFQFQRFVEDELAAKIASSSIKAILLVTPKCMFFDQNLLEEEYRAMFSETINELKSIAQELNVLAIVINCTDCYPSERDYMLNEVLDMASNWNVNIEVAA